MTGIYEHFFRKKLFFIHVRLEIRNFHVVL
jgi:hypothetical protein